MTWKPITLGGGITLSADGTITLQKPRPTIAAFQNAMGFLTEMEERCPLYFGDLLNLAKKLHPDRYTQLLDATGYRPATAAKHAWIAERTTADERAEFHGKGVQISHYEAVATLPTATKVKTLKKALSEGWSIHRLKGHIKKHYHRETVLEGGTVDLRALFVKYMSYLADDGHPMPALDTDRFTKSEVVELQGIMREAEVGILDKADIYGVG